MIMCQGMARRGIDSQVKFYTILILARVCMCKQISLFDFSLLLRPILSPTELKFKLIHRAIPLLFSATQWFSPMILYH